MQIIGRPALARPSNSHCDKGPASSPTRSNRQAGSLSTRAISSGWVGTFTSPHTVPVSSTMQIAVSFTETSNPAQCFMLRFSFLMAYGCSREPTTFYHQLEAQHLDGITAKR
ncbi:hypothetical protein X743_34360 [Mesorhizobium sp. LNHC252B00]|nr:hypothetical protein X743_34360 [Mesorhizobium sp. LNHC252B00]